MPKSIVQSVLVPKSKYNRDEAISYVRKHFDYKKIDSNQRKNFYSFRQEEPTKLKNKGYNGYITKVLPNKVELVIAVKN